MTSRSGIRSCAALTRKPLLEMRSLCLRDSVYIHHEYDAAWCNISYWRDVIRDLMTYTIINEASLVNSRFTKDINDVFILQPPPSSVSYSNSAWFKYRIERRLLKRLGYTHPDIVTREDHNIIVATSDSFQQRFNPTHKLKKGVLSWSKNLASESAVSGVGDVWGFPSYFYSKSLWTLW